MCIYLLLAQENLVLFIYEKEIVYWRQSKPQTYLDFFFYSKAPTHDCTQDF